MNQERIGKFIAKCRKDKNLTQEKLASMLGITDRAVSKWERGLNLPDASLMLDLANILGISVNELLTGEIIEKDEYMKKAEENLVEILEMEENNNKKLMMYEYVIGTISSVTFLVLMFVLSFAVENTIARIILFILGLLILIVGISFALKIETETGYYECKKCHHKHIPKYMQVYFAMHMGTTRYLKCPKCNKYSWNKKTLKR